jgi:hypothetical protein
MKYSLLVATSVLLTSACGGGRSAVQPPAPTTASAPVLTGLPVMIFPTQRGPIPLADTALHRYPVAADKLDAEIAYWLPQLAGAVRWTLPVSIQRAISRSPSLAIDINNLAVASFHRAQVKRVGDPLFGDLRKLAAVLDTRIAVIPVAAEFIGKTRADARLQIAAAVIDAMDGTVLWYGILQGDAPAAQEDAAMATAAQALARAFAGKR